MNRRPPLTPGRMWYLFYHAPLAALARSHREGGPVRQWLTLRGRKAMHHAAAQLPPLAESDPAAPEITFLTGRKFWYQTAFCFWSLRQTSQVPFRLVLLDDGTLDRNAAGEAARLFPGTRCLSSEAVAPRLAKHLPCSRFPRLASQRESYLHLRKLTDAHAGGTGWKLVLDSDMLFFRRPDRLLSWLEKPLRPLHLQDVQDAYGYPTADLERLAGGAGRLPRRLNVGILGLQSETIDWVALEDACSNLIEMHGSSYYLEQALSALIVARCPAEALPGDDYRVMPSFQEAANPSAVLHHYVAESKAGYFRCAWRRVASLR